MAPEKQPRLPSWSAISLDMAGLVLRQLPAFADRGRFAVVCPLWRAALRQLQTSPAHAALRQLQTSPAHAAVAQARQLLPPSLPLLALPDGTFYSLPYSKRLLFPGCGFAGYESTCGSWLVFQRDDGCFLVDPFSREKVTLPPLSRVRLRPPNAVAQRSVELESREAYPRYTWMHIEEEGERLQIRKLILCSTNLVAALVGLGRSQILICQPGALSWSVRAHDELQTFQDMIFYQGKLYAITEDQHLLVVNISQDHSTGDPQISKIGRVIREKGMYEDIVYRRVNFRPHEKLYLVESRGMLLMVRRTLWHSNRIALHLLNDFEVFEADFKHSRWVKVSSVGGDVLFLGRTCSRAVPVSQYRLPGDRIFYLDDYDEENADQYRYDRENTSCVAVDLASGDISLPHPLISWMRSDEMRLAAWLFPRDLLK